MTDTVLPSPVDRLVEAGMDTFRESDRLLALQAANHYDRAENTRYGAEVLMMFMEEIGLEFLPSKHSRNEIRLMPHTARDARLMQAVDFAIGEEIGVASEFLELVGSNDRCENVYVSASRESPKRYVKKKQAAPGVTDQRPYLVHQRIAKDKGWWNFSRAVRAIVGITNVDIADWGLLHEDWRATLSKIRALDETQVSH